MHSAPDSPQTRFELIDNYNRYAQGLDSKDWAMVRACFSDEVCIDYGGISDPTGSPDVARRADDWLKVLQGVINGFDITRHIITNHRFEIGDSLVSCQAYLTADHVIFTNPEVPVVSPEDVVTVVGEYTNHYVRDVTGWKICYSKLVVNYTGGNLALLGQAMERAESLAQ